MQPDLQDIPVFPLKIDRLNFSIYRLDPSRRVNRSYGFPDLLKSNHKR